MMKKIIVLLLVLTTIFTLSACGNDNKTDDPTTEVPSETTTEEQTDTSLTIETFIDATFENRISFKIPEKFKDKYTQKVQSSFSDGYYAITICVKDTNYDLFTIYCTKNEDYKEKENNKGYEILAQEKGYTCVWYEYQYESTDDTKLPDIVGEFESEYKNIKSSFFVG